MAGSKIDVDVFALGLGFTDSGGCFRLQTSPNDFITVTRQREAWN